MNDHTASLDLGKSLYDNLLLGCSAVPLHLVFFFLTAAWRHAYSPKHLNRTKRNFNV